MKAFLILAASTFLFGAGYSVFAAAIATIGGLMYIVYDQEPADPKAKGSGCWAVMVCLLLFWLIVIAFFIK